MSYSMPELIGTKRDGGVLAAEELEWIITEYTADRIPDYQLSAFLMAIIFQGLNGDELSAWTDAMLHSGDVLDLSATSIPKVDKHSCCQKQRHLPACWKVRFRIHCVG